MKKLISILTMLICSTTIYATDYTLLENLISAHKAQSNKLKEKGQKDITIMGIGENEKGGTVKYEELCKKVSKRMGDIFSYTVFAADMVNIVSLSKDVIELESKAIEMGIKVGTKHTKLLTRVYNLQNDFAIMTKEIADLTIYTVAGGLNITMATQEQRKDFTSLMYQKLSIMKRKLTSFLWYARCTSYESVSKFKRIKESWDFIQNMVDETEKRNIMNGIKNEIKNLK